MKIGDPVRVTTEEGSAPGVVVGFVTKDQADGPGIRVKGDSSGKTKVFGVECVEAQVSDPGRRNERP